MDWLFPKYSIPLLISAIISTVIAFYAWRRRSRPGAAPFTLLMLAIAEWSLTYALELEAVEIHTKLLWAKAQYLGIVVVPAAMLLMVLGFCGQQQWLSRRFRTILAIEPTIIFALASTNGIHGLIWREIKANSSEALYMLEYIHGPAFWFHTLYSYILLFLATAFLIQFLMRRPRVYRGQALAVLIAACVPWAGNLLYVSGLNPFQNLDLTPFFFTISGIAAGWALFRYQLFDIVPVARSSVIEGMGDGVIVLDLQDHIVDLNPAALDILALGSSGLIGQPISQALSAYPLVAEIIQNPEEIQTEIKIESGNEKRQLDIRTSPIRHEQGQLIGRLTVLRDISLQKEAEEAVKESEERYRRLVELSPVAIAVHSEGKIVYANPACSRLFRASSQEELLGRPALDFIHPDYLDIVKERIQRGYQEGLPARLINEKMIRLDGQIIDVEVAAQPITFQGNPATQVVILDITERKRAEYALRNTNMVLEDALSELKSAQRKIVQHERLAAVGQLAAGIAHDFNNALTPIILYCEMIRDKFELPPKMLTPLEAILDQAQHATDLTQQILDFGRRSLMKPQPLEIISFLEDLRQLLRITLPESILIEIVHSQEEYWIEGDPSRLKQMFVNLAGNARDAMPKGGKLCFSVSRFQIKPGDPPPFLDMPPGEWIQVNIADTGEGVHDDHLSHIFEPFYTTKDPGKGSGLGLAQVYGIVKQHHGYIDVSSKEGEGTIFTCYYPAVKGDREVTTEAFVPERLDGNLEKILVVEDDEITRHAICDILELLNYRVSAVDCGTKAAELFKQEGADLVLSDLIMPEMGGVELYKVLHNLDPGIRMVLITGYPLDEEGGKLLEQASVSWVQKPINMNSLSKIVWEALHRE
ncbi:MAG: PAS domain S-box protein [Chloroflexi bacterium]|nr:PAS domain S-box protein [Chloroflexota bacterium]